MYAGKAFDYTELLKCYYEENYPWQAWEDERWVELAQNTGALWVHEALKRHPQRTTTPSEAALFVLPIDGYISDKLRKPCNGRDHSQRMQDIAREIKKSPYYARRRGAGEWCCVAAAGGLP